jgi:hypothetical protein
MFTKRTKLVVTTTIAWRRGHTIVTRIRTKQTAVTRDEGNTAAPAEEGAGSGRGEERGQQDRR